MILDNLDNTFNFRDCTFNLDKTKINTLRGNLFSITNNYRIMTIESSFLGFNKNGNL